MPTANLLSNVAVRAFFGLCKGADTPTSLGLWLCVKHGDYSELVTHVIDPKAYVDYNATRLGGCFSRRGVATFSRDYACVNYLRKADFLPCFEGDAVNARKQSALAGFIADETSNARINSAFRRGAYGPFTVEQLADQENREVADVLFKAQRSINRLLEPFVTGFDYLGETRFGPGATALLPRDRATVVNKTLYVGDVTPTAFVLASHLIGSDPVRFEAVTGQRPDGACCLLQGGLNRTWRPRLKIDSSGVISPVSSAGVFVGKWEVGNHYLDELVFVPKDAMKDRTITAQAGVNLELQFGPAAVMRRALRVWGIDLSTQVANQEAAFSCFQPASAPESLTGDATLDLTNASNRNVKASVRFLLDGGAASRRLLLLMESSRGQAWAHPRTKVGRPYQMFSAMGNGYTFELETLIFASIARACAGVDAHRVLVFGDDIIAPKTCVPLLTRCLAAIGHEVNARKSYSAGLFYESCGKHFFEGFDVTPAYQKVDPTSASERIRAHNRLVRLAYRLSYGSRGRSEVTYLASWVKPACKTYYSDALTDREMFPSGVPVQPISRERTYTAFRPEGTFMERQNRLSHSPIFPARGSVGDLYEQDAGFAVGRQLIGASRLKAVKYRWRSGCWVTSGLLEVDAISPGADRPEGYDLAAYAAWLRSPVREGVSWQQSEQKTRYSRLQFWDGWTESAWLAD